MPALVHSAQGSWLTPAHPMVLRSHTQRKSVDWDHATPFRPARSFNTEVHARIGEAKEGPGHATLAGAFPLVAGVSDMVTAPGMLANASPGVWFCVAMGQREASSPPGCLAVTQGRPPMRCGLGGLSTTGLLAERAQPIPVGLLSHRSDRQGVERLGCGFVAMASCWALRSIWMQAGADDP